MHSDAKAFALVLYAIPVSKPIPCINLAHRSRPNLVREQQLPLGSV